MANEDNDWAGIVILLFLIMLIGGCSYTCCKHITKKPAPAGYTYAYGGDQAIVKIGPSTQFVRVLQNGDSLFTSCVVDANGYPRDAIYYTTGGATKTLEWNVKSGQSSHQEINVQK